jgi:hypothetical protein
LLEIEVWPVVHLVPATFGVDNGTACQICGRLGVQMWGRVVVNEATVPSGVDLFRAVEAPTHILCADRFFEAVAEGGLTGVRFEEAEIVKADDPRLNGPHSLRRSSEAAHERLE